MRRARNGEQPRTDDQRLQRKAGVQLPTAQLRPAPLPDDEREQRQRRHQPARRALGHEADRGAEVHQRVAARPWRRLAPRDSRAMRRAARARSRPAGTHRARARCSTRNAVSALIATSAAMTAAAASGLHRERQRAHRQRGRSPRTAGWGRAPPRPSPRTGATRAADIQYDSGGFSRNGTPASCGSVRSLCWLMRQAMSASRGSSGVHRPRPNIPDEPQRRERQHDRADPPSAQAPTDAAVMINSSPSRVDVRRARLCATGPWRDRALSDGGCSLGAQARFLGWVQVGRQRVAHHHPRCAGDRSTSAKPWQTSRAPASGALSE